MTHQTHNPIHHGPDGAAADPVDAFFDQRAEGDAASRLAGALRADVRTAGEFARTQRLVSMLRQPMEGPDLTDAILRRLEERRAFGARLRRPRFGGRLAACVGLALGATALWLVERNTHPAPGPAAPPGTVAARSDAVRPALAPAPRSRPAGEFGRLSIGTTSARQLARAGEGGLVLPRGAGDNTRSPGLFDGGGFAPASGEIEWGWRGESLLAIPALRPGPDGGSALIGVPVRREARPAR